MSRMVASGRGARTRILMVAWLALACALPCAAAQNPDPAPRAAQLDSAPPAAQREARLAWAAREADRLRARIVAHRRDALAPVMLAALAVVVADDLERALARGERNTARSLRALIAGKLADTPVWLDYISRHGAGGGDFALAVATLHGILGPRDTDAACARFASAFDKGFSDAAYRVSGCAAARDPARSAALLRAAAATGHAGAREDLGRRCLESAPPDLECAAVQLGAAAAAGRASAKSLLGWMNAEGLGMTRNPVRAQQLYREAAMAGDLSAMNNLGELLETGRGIPLDRVRAADYYREAAEAGFAPAQFNLGRMYASGSGVERDFHAARKWLRAALDAGVPSARQVLDWMDAQDPAHQPYELPPPGR